jgi:RimJ/RimL family protein N-acetyltransferase
MILREVTDADLPVLWAHQNDQQAHEMAGFSAYREQAAFEERMLKILAKPEIIILAIELEGKVLGTVGKWVAETQDEINYWIDPEHWGKGIASQAVKLFLEMYTHRPIYGHTAADNFGSIRVLEKNGFQRIDVKTSWVEARSSEIQEISWILN